MQQEVYPNQNLIPIRRRYRICGCLDISYGGPIVCFIWMVITTTKKVYHIAYPRKELTSFFIGYKYVRMYSFISR